MKKLEVFKLKKYNSNWNAKKLTVNFNQKQWRQDLAAFIREKKYWHQARVTRSRAANNNPFNKGSKIFEIYNGAGGSFYIQYKNNCEIESATDLSLVEEYMKVRI